MIFGVWFSAPEPCPSSVEQSCGEVADDLCPGEHRGDYSSSQAEECRRKVFQECLYHRSTPIEDCRNECTNIVKDLTQANEDLWQRWLACAEMEEGNHGQ